MRILSLAMGLVSALASAIFVGLMLPADSNASAALAVLALAAGIAGYEFGEWMRGFDETARST
jgi:hypothetical protein